ncbi:MAG: hypothetical protein Q4C60_07235, partial [Eubacteriales bacterium]|nr:hypothetical protein [Eubacteriales bacterium]
FHYYLCRQLKGGGMDIFMIRKLQLPLLFTAALLLGACGASAQTAPETAETAVTMTASESAPASKSGAVSESVPASKSDAVSGRTAVSGSTQAVAGKTIEPLPLSFAEQASDTMPDGTWHVSFDASSLSEENGTKYLSLTFYEYDRYSVDSIESLTVGDTIVCKQQDCLVRDLILTENDGKLNLAEINGGYGNGGFSLLYDKEEDIFRETLWDDYYELYSIGTGRLPLSKDLFITDYSGLDSPYDELPEDHVGNYDSLDESLQNTSFHEQNTYATVRSGEIVEIRKTWVP